MSFGQSVLVCTCTQAVWMTKGLDSFLSLAYHMSQDLGHM